VGDKGDKGAEEQRSRGALLTPFLLSSCLLPSAFCLLPSKLLNFYDEIFLFG
jgi:hypothetical protein